MWVPSIQKVIVSRGVKCLGSMTHEGEGQTSDTSRLREVHDNLVEKEQNPGEILDEAEYQFFTPLKDN